MWFYIWFGQIFLLITNVISRRSNEDVKLNAYNKTVLTDVIKNISKVSDVLQDLMKEQEQFEEINQSQGFVGDSEDEEGESYSENKEKPEDTVSVYNKKAVENKHDSSQRVYHVTRMLQSSEEKELSSDSKSDNNEINNKALYEKTATKIEIRDNFRPIILDNEESGNPTSSSEERTSDEKEPYQKPMGNKHVEILFDNPENIFTTLAKPKSTETNVDDSIGIKKRYKLIEHRGDEINSQSDSQSLSSIRLGLPKPITEAGIKPKSINIKKIVRTETFHQGKIWDDITNNKPINLKPEIDDSDFKSRPKAAVVVATKSSNQDTAEKDRSLESQEDAAMDKEIFKSKILRQAYGDVCLKVAIRKCYKACKSANNEVCYEKNCKSSFKEKFKEMSRTGCIKEFINNGSTKTSKDLGKVFDMTRQGYMATCLPMLTPSQRENETSPVSSNMATATKGNDLNILRDRYEKACQKISRDKCSSACKYALKETCDVYECRKSRKKSFGKACHRQCKIAYSSSSKKSSSDTSDSLSSESTDEDTSGSKDSSSS